MDKMQNSTHCVINKGCMGYIEQIIQYTGKNDNVAVNIHENTYMNFHLHDFFEINYIVKGECKNLFEDGPLIMQEGDFVIIHPSAMHSLFVDDSSKVYNFIVSREFFYNFSSKIKNCESDDFALFIKTAKKEKAYKYLYIKNSLETSFIANKLIRVENSSVKSLLLEAILTELLLTVSLNNENAHVSETTVQSTTILRNILIRMQYDYKDISLNVISKEYGYSKAHICKLFKKHYNSTFSQKLNQIRVLRAQKLLLDTDMTVYDIAFSLGFDSVEYFHRLFKKVCGVTPNKYRNRDDNDKYEGERI